VKRLLIAAALTLLVACVPPQKPTSATWSQLQIAPLPQATPLVDLVPTCNVREFQYEIRYAGWYALLAKLGGIEGVYYDTIVYRNAGELVKVYVELPFIAFRVGYSVDGKEPWHDASNTRDGWSQCI